jgi:hypothetical protein
MLILETGDYLIFDIITQVVFGRSFDILTTPGSRFILEVIEVRVFCFSLLYQLLQFVNFKINKILTWYIAEKAKAFQAASREIAEAWKLEGEFRNQDIYGTVLAAKDLDTGELFLSIELRSKSTLLIIAGIANLNCLFLVRVLKVQDKFRVDYLIGSEKSATGLATALFYLLYNLDAYYKLAQEIQSTFIVLEDIHSGHALSSCIYLRACITETLQMCFPLGKLCSMKWKAVL